MEEQNCTTSLEVIITATTWNQTLLKDWICFVARTDGSIVYTRPNTGKNYDLASYIGTSKFSSCTHKIPLARYFLNHINLCPQVWSVKVLNSDGACGFFWGPSSVPTVLVFPLDPYKALRRCLYIKLASLYTNFSLMAYPSHHMKVSLGFIITTSSLVSFPDKPHSEEICRFIRQERDIKGTDNFSKSLIKVNIF